MPLTEQQVMEKLNLKPWVTHGLDAIQKLMDRRRELGELAVYDEIIVHGGRGVGRTTKMLVSAVVNASHGYPVFISAFKSSYAWDLRDSARKMCVKCGVNPDLIVDTLSRATVELVDHYRSRSRRP